MRRRARPWGTTSPRPPPELTIVRPRSHAQCLVIDPTTRSAAQNRLLAMNSVPLSPSDGWDYDLDGPGRCASYRCYGGALFARHT